jgi:chemotaxis protein MotB
MTRSIPLSSGTSRRFFRSFTPSNLRTLAFAVSATTLLGGCVSMDEYKAVRAALEQSEAQLAKADHDLQEARAQIAALQKRIDELNILMRANGDLDKSLRDLRDLYEKRLADLQARYDELLKLSSTPVLPAPVNAALRELAAQYPQYLEFDERLGMLRMKSDVTFDLGSTEVKPEAKRVLALVAQILNKPEIANNEVQVVGHTDNVPIRPGGPMSTRNPDNWTLSTNRAWSVLDVLRANGLSGNRGMGAGWGEQRPIAPNAATGGNERNRRVEIYIRAATVPEGLPVSAPRSAPAPVRPAAPAPARGGVEIPR